MWKNGKAWLEKKTEENTVATEKQQNKSYSFIFLMMKMMSKGQRWKLIILLHENNSYL